MFPATTNNPVRDSSGAYAISPVRKRRAASARPARTFQAPYRRVRRSNDEGNYLRRYVIGSCYVAIVTMSGMFGLESIWSGLQPSHWIRLPQTRPMAWPHMTTHLRCSFSAGMTAIRWEMRLSALFHEGAQNFLVFNCYRSRVAPLRYSGRDDKSEFRCLGEESFEGGAHSRSLHFASPNFLWMLLESANFMRLSLMKAAHAAVSQSRVAGNPGSLRSG